MKRYNTIALIAMALAIAVLFFFQFVNLDRGDKKPSDIANKIPSNIGAVPSSIAFVDMDTLLISYEYYLDQRDELQAKQEKTGADLQDRFKSWERTAAKLEEDRQKLLITRKDYEESGQRLIQERDNLLQMQESLSTELLEEEQVMNRRVYFEILEYLKRYNADKKYQYILSHTFGGNILLADEMYDITEEVLAGLNAEYTAK